jgi:hypothetical protein
VEVIPLHRAVGDAVAGPRVLVGEGGWTYTANLSRGGLLLELPDAPPNGAKLELRLQLSEGQPLVLRATVRHATAVSQQGPKGADAYHLVGVQFEPLGEEARRIIDDTLEAAERDEI